MHWYKTFTEASAVYCILLQLRVNYFLSEKAQKSNTERRRNAVDIFFGSSQKEMPIHSKFTKIYSVPHYSKEIFLLLCPHLIRAPRLDVCRYSFQIVRPRR